MKSQKLNNDLSVEPRAIEIRLPHASFGKLAKFGCDALSFADGFGWRAWLTDQGIIVTDESCDPYGLNAEFIGFSMEALEDWLEFVAVEHLEDYKTGFGLNLKILKEMVRNGMTYDFFVKNYSTFAR